MTGRPPFFLALAAGLLAAGSGAMQPVLAQGVEPVTAPTPIVGTPPPPVLSSPVAPATPAPYQPSPASVPTPPRPFATPAPLPNGFERPSAGRATPPPFKQPGPNAPVPTPVPETVPAGRPLMLDEAVLRARDNSLAARASDATWRSSQADKAATVSGALPTLSLQTTGNYSQLPGSQASAFGAFGSNTVGFPANGTYVDTTLSASFVLFDAFATHDSIAISDQTILINRLAAAQARQDAMLNAGVGYFEVLRSEGLARVARDAVKQAQDHLRLGALRVKAGLGTRAELLQLRAQMANARGAYTQAQNAVNLARLTLANAINSPVGDRPLETHSDLPALAVSIERDLAVGLKRRPEIAQAVAREQVDQTRASLESRATWPNVTGSTRFSQRGLGDGQFLAAVSLNWNLFDGFKSRNRVESARQAAIADQYQLEAARQRIALEIRQQYQAREEASSRVEISREGLVSSQDAYRLALRRYQVGLATSFEVVDVQNTLITASNNYIQAVNDLRGAQIRLARALGVDLGRYLAGRTTPE